MTAPVDLRSDTVTKPSAAMRQAMAEQRWATTCSTRSTTRRLEARIAGLLGTEGRLVLFRRHAGDQSR